MLESRFLETERLLLRKPLKSDLDFFICLYGDRDVMRHIPPEGKPLDTKEAKARFEHLISHWNAHGYGMYLIEWKKTGQLAGYCGLRYLEDTNHIELGYIIDTHFQGKGIATEAASICMNHAQHTLETNSLISVTHPTNHASQNILKKLGFQRYEKLDGTYHGMKHYFFRRSFHEIQKKKPINVIAAIIKQNNRYLFTKRSETEDTAAGFWAPVCGTVKPGESQEDTVKREVKEEVNLVVTAKSKTGELLTDDHGAILHWWTVVIDSGEASVVTDELSEIRWVTLDEMKQLKPVFKRQIEVFENLSE